MNRSVGRSVVGIGFIVLMLAVLACGPLSGLTGQVQSQVQVAVDQAVTSGTTQWATSATASSEYGAESWSAQQVLGIPDTTECGDIETAWATANSSGVDWIQVGYPIAVLPARIDIYETYNPGAVVQVEVANTSTGFSQTVYTAAEAPNDQCPFTLSVDTSSVTQPVNQVTVHLDQTNHNGWNEIDAIGLVSQ